MKKTFKMEFKQNGKWWRLIEIPMDRLSGAKKLIKNMEVRGRFNCEGIGCSECPLHQSLYDGYNICVEVAKPSRYVRSSVKIIK